MIELSFRDLRTDGDVRERFEVLLRIVADFTIAANGRTLYSEIEFCVVELASMLHFWLEGRFEQRQPFEYDSMESDVSDLVWIRPVEQGWNIGSPHQEYVDQTVWSGDVVQVVARGFIDEVIRRARQELMIDVLQVVKHSRWVLPSS